MTGRQRVLVTNDDGIDAPGLRWLARAAVDLGHEVVIAAPESEASGASSGLSATYHEHRLAVNSARVRGLDVEAQI